MKYQFNNYVILYIWLIIQLPLFLTCEKTTFKRTITGQIIDSIYYKPIIDVEIRLLQNSSFESTTCENLIAIPDNNGKFQFNWNPCYEGSISIQPFFKVVNYKTYPNYRLDPVIINPSDLKFGESKDLTFYGPPLSKITINAINNNPYDENDCLHIFISNWLSYDYYGTESGTIESIVSGDKAHPMGWTITKNNITSNYFRDTIYVKAFEDIEYTINY